MGAYWIRMKIRPDMDEGALQQLLELQAQAYRAAISHPASWFNEALRDFQGMPESEELIGQSINETGNVAARANFRAASDAILALVILEERDSASNRPIAFRTNPIDRTWVFPCEWAYRGIRSYLAPDLERQVATWRGHFEVARRGAYRAYHMQRYLYQQSCALYEQWLQFRAVALRSRGRTNTWTQQPAFQAIRSQLLALPPPPFEAAPLWEHWRGVEAITAGQQAAYEGQQDYQACLFPLASTWNRSVPRNQKRMAKPLTGMIDFETFISSLNHPWVEECLNWLVETAAEGQGVYLDA